MGWHVVRAVATDDQGASQASASTAITVYDVAGTPLVALTSPANGAVFEGPTNLALTATATAVRGVTNVLFLANDVVIATATASPYSIIWSNAAFGTNLLSAVATDALGLQATSAPVRIVVNTPPVNSNAPVIVSVNPSGGAILAGLTNIQVTFSERVLNVDAADLLVNGTPATSLSGSGSNYTFSVIPPGLGAVTVTWAAGHGITDIGWPASLPFDETSTNASWSYTIMDLVPPTIIARSPVAGATVTNLTQITITFSEAVLNVNAGDLLINGSPAIGLSGPGPSYTFVFPQPAHGNVNVTWASGHGICDLATPPNAFNATGPGATWTYTLDARIVLVQTNSLWYFHDGLAEASSPTNAWRQLDFVRDNTWTNLPAVFYFGETWPVGSHLAGMSNRYTSFFLRAPFVINHLAAYTNLTLLAECDDGFIAWINGTEVYRYNAPAGEPAVSSLAPRPVTEYGTPSVLFTNYALPNPQTYLVEGTNVLAVQVFNAGLSSSDIVFDAQLWALVADASLVAPRLFRVSPLAGEVYTLTNLTVTFSEPVGGVDAADLLVNGLPATAVAGGASNDIYTLSFPQPAYGLVFITWATNHGILDFDATPKPFAESLAGSTWQYNLLNPNAPTVTGQSPAPGMVSNFLTQIMVTFSKPVTNVDAGDLLVGGQPATSINGSGAVYTFAFPSPPYGNVTVGWRASHGITDLETPPIPFDALRPSAAWQYNLVDCLGPAVAMQTPPAGASVTNLSSLSVTFTENVTGVDMSDLLINGVPATGVSGSGSNYTFRFPQPNASVIQITWAQSHGITDTASPANAFNALGANWSYLTLDNVPPTMAGIGPPAGATVRSLGQLTITFSEPVAGVEAGDLLINGVAALNVSGFGAGPYTFAFAAPPTGQVQVAWLTNHGITDLALPPNAFAGGSWTYTLDPNARFDGAVVINEIMYNPLSEGVNDEWIELHNTTGEAINLAGWRLSRGVDFTFPEVTLPPAGYLVVAADLTAFQALYPAVTNVVGIWTGRLKNSDEAIQLEDVAGNVINRVHYASEGEWATRMSGAGEIRLPSLYRVGGTAYATTLGHYQSGDQVVISGADQPDYNGTFSISASGILGCMTNFTFPVSATAPTPATGLIICRQLTDVGGRGWSWATRADGLGSSLELVNPALPNQYGQNWKASATLHGTPGRANSIVATNVAPLIAEVAHFPPVPKPSDNVVVTARIIDEQAGISVLLYYRDHTTTSPGSFSTTPMADDGVHGDGVPGDGIYGGIIPAFPNGAIIEFYILAQDAQGLNRTWPAPAIQQNGSLAQNANAVYQVDDNLAPASASTTNQPFYRFIMTATERNYFSGINNNSDAEMNGTAARRLMAPARERAGGRSCIWNR